MSKTWTLAVLIISGLFVSSGLARAGNRDAVNPAWDWTITQVVNGGINAVGLDHDAAGTAYICYQDTANQRLTLVFGEVGAWETEIVEQGASDDVGGSCTLAVAADGSVHIAYRAERDAGARALKYAKRTDVNTWNSLVVPTASGLDQGFDPSLVLDASGHPRIAHWCNEGTPQRGLLYSYWDGGQWNTENVGLQGAEPSLALDAAGDPHMVVRMWDTGTRYTWKEAGAWKFEDVRTDTWGGCFTFDATDMPHLITRSVDSKIMTHMWHSASVWQWEVMYFDPDVESDPSTITLAGFDYYHALTRGTNSRTWGDGVDHWHKPADGAWTRNPVYQQEETLFLQASLNMRLVNDEPRITFSDGSTLWYAKASARPQSAPDQPVNISPTDAAQNIPLEPTLQSSAFSDADTTDTHAASQWQAREIGSAGDYSDTAFDSGTDEANLTSITLPAMTLAYSSSYFWRVRHQDNHSAWSPWSTETSFETLKQYEVLFVTDGTPGASLDGSTSQTVTHGDDATSVTAVAPVSHHFVNWTLDGADYSTSRSLVVLNVTRPMKLVAHFFINEYTLTYMADANGSIVGETSQVIAYGSDGATVEAVPATDYEFVKWSDNSTQNPRTDMNVTSDINVTAIFAHIPNYGSKLITY